MPDELPAQRGSAKAVLLTMLGEFVLPAGGSAWTATLLAGATTLDITEKNARQALARIRDQGLIDSERHGRTVRWSLTPTGTELLETGARRIYSFGTASVPWTGEWLVAHCPVPEEQRALRSQLRTRLGFLGFGELSPSLLVSPHPDRQDQLEAVLADLDLLDASLVLRSTVGSLGGDADLAARSWELAQLEAAYERFAAAYASVDVADDADAFRRVVELVHEWRRFPFIDPELPVELLPDRWAGAHAAAIFHERHRSWSPSARRWFEAHESEIPDVTRSVS